MMYVISRTSEWDDEVAPCEKAVKLPYLRVDRRVVSSPERLKKGSEDWYSEGINHRVVNGYIERDFKDETWFVDIKTIEDLQNLVKECGSIIISKFLFNQEYFSLEIYDDYRE